MTDYRLELESGYISLSPTIFRRTAQEFYRCFLDFKKPVHFSVVPYFLCCRAIELALKAIHLETSSQIKVKQDFGHDLLKSYKALPQEKQLLYMEDLDLLSNANNIYWEKHFEYGQAADLLGLRKFPDLKALALLTKKIIDLSLNT
jgi:hypothetical protein